MGNRGSTKSEAARGTVSLVALCFVTVLGISLASYITISSRTMQLSNRSFQASVSKQLAEVGIEEALRAFNKNNWDDWTSSGISTDWTLDTTNKRATATMTFPAGKFGQGTTASVKIRVDNYDAARVGKAWTSAKTYRIGEVLTDSGAWFASLRHNNTNNSPGTSGPFTWWSPAPIPSTWSVDITYNQYDLANRNGIWYRYYNNASTAGNVPPQPISSSTHWVTVPSMREWAASTSYALYDLVAYTHPASGEISVHRCLSNHTSTNFAADASNWSTNVQTISFSWNGSTIYTRGVIVLYNSVWYYCRKSGLSATAPSSDTDRWAPVLTSSGDLVTPTDVLPTAGIRYVPGDYIYYSSSWRRCTTEHTFSSWGADSAKWTTTNAIPLITWAWRYSPAKTYRFNDVAYYNNQWWRCIIASYNSNNWWEYPGSTWAPYWENALSGSMHGWSSSLNYNLGDVVYHSGTSAWYRCTRANSGQTPSGSSIYWANTPLFSPDWDSSKQYSQNDTVRHNGVWYLSIHSGTSNIAQNPSTATSYWIGADTTSASYTWNAATSYSVGTYRCYGGVWYRCTAAHSNKSPNDTAYWTAAWSNSWGITTGAPVIYVEATVNLANSPTQKTQLRAPIAPAPLFPNAAGATNNLTITTGTGTVDSYDYSLGTGYAAQVGNATTNFSAVLTARSTLAINGTTAVKGYLAAPSLPANISTGTTAKGPSSPASPNLAPDRLSRSPYVPQFDTIPSGDLTSAWAGVHKGVLLTGSSVVNLGTPGATTPSRYYYSGTWLQLGSAESIQTININGPVILYIDGSLRMRNGSAINVASPGSLELHVAKQLLFENGTSGLVNTSPNSSNPDPKKLILIVHSGTSDVQAYRYVNNFHGVIYVPYSTASSGLTVYNSMNTYGAISAKNITFADAANLHYDTSLRYATFSGVDQPYAVTEWRELPVTEQATLP